MSFDRATTWKTPRLLQRSVTSCPNVLDRTTCLQNPPVAQSTSPLSTELDRLSDQFDRLDATSAAEDTLQRITSNATIAEDQAIKPRNAAQAMRDLWERLRITHQTMPTTLVVIIPSAITATKTTTTTTITILATETTTTTITITDRRTNDGLTMATETAPKNRI